MSPQLPDLAKKLLEADTFVTLTTLAKDGTPHSTVMWADHDGDDIIFATVVGRVKERHISRDPRVSVSLFDPANPYAYVTVNGCLAPRRRPGAHPAAVAEIHRRPVHARRRHGQRPGRRSGVAGAYLPELSTARSSVG
ncbi:MAG: TIGR03618 family F420-dependent PPOX class oxidoreductase [Actinomycetota bacterium]|nr:TIGR03618 family F420-dependent PPOX class oxidoreductase [Actinomycetota bacterium]